MNRISLPSTAQRQPQNTNTVEVSKSCEDMQYVQGRAETEHFGAQSQLHAKALRRRAPMKIPNNYMHTWHCSNHLILKTNFLLEFPRSLSRIFHLCTGRRRSEFCEAVRAVYQNPAVLLHIAPQGVLHALFLSTTHTISQPTTNRLHQRILLPGRWIVGTTPTCGLFYQRQPQPVANMLHVLERHCEEFATIIYRIFRTNCFCFFSALDVFVFFRRLVFMVQFDL